MEWITIILASLLTAISPAGLILDRVVKSNIQSQVKAVEQLEVRLDNTPSYQILQGKIDRIRIASRGIQPITDFRIEQLELETDPISVDLERFRQGGENALIEALRQPLQGAIHLVITQADLNQALQSPKLQAQLQQLSNRSLPQRDSQQDRFELSKARLEFLENNRVRLQIQISSSDSPEAATQALEFELEVGVEVVAGRKLQLTNPTGKINQRPLSTALLQGFAQGINEQLDLQRLERQGITARLLKFNITEEALDLVAFIRVEPSILDRRQ